MARANLSIDSHKGVVEPARVEALAASLRAAQPALEIVLIATLDTPEFAARLVDDGLLEALVDLPAVDKVALNALKPPPPWCDRAFWMRALGAARAAARRGARHAGCFSTATWRRGCCGSAAARRAPICRRRRAASPFAVRLPAGGRFRRR